MHATNAYRRAKNYYNAYNHLSVYTLSKHCNILTIEQHKQSFLDRGTFKSKGKRDKKEKEEALYFQITRSCLNTVMSNLKVEQRESDEFAR